MVMLFSAQDGAILADCRSETEGILINITGQEKLHKRKACETFPVLERKGDHPTPVGWWKVECCMLEPGNNGCMWHFFLCVKEKNAKALQMESMRNVSRSGERGGMTTIACRHWL